LRIRTYERPLVAAIPILLLAALLVLIFLAEGSADRPRASSADAQTPARAARPSVADVAPGQEAQAPRPTADAVAAGGAGRDTTDGEAPVVPEASTPAPPPPEPVGCVAPGMLLQDHSDLAAVSADPAGRFAFYGLPDPETGLPGGDSHDLLRGCAARAEAALLFLNPVRVCVAGDEARTIGPRTVSERTRGDGDALLTRHRLPAGLAVTQRLSLVPARGRFTSSRAPDTLRASYTLENLSAAPLTANLSAVLSPARGPFSNENSGVPYFANHPPQGPGPVGAVAITSARILRASRAEIPEELIVPRPGAAASSTSYWRALGASPDRIAFGPAVDLASGDPLPARRGRPLPDGSAFASLWDGIDLAPGEAATVAYEYGMTSGWPR